MSTKEHLDYQTRLRNWLSHRWGIENTEFQLRLLNMLPPSCQNEKKGMQWLTQYLSLQKIKPILPLEKDVADFYLKF